MTYYKNKDKVIKTKSRTKVGKEQNKKNKTKYRKDQDKKEKKQDKITANVILSIEQFNNIHFLCLRT